MCIRDRFKHKGLRNKLVAELIKKGIKDLSVLDAISKVPRHMFMDSSFIDHAYQDKAFPISSGQTISQPYTVAFQSQLLQIEKGDKILEIGTGSGYQAAVLCEMGVKLYTIERIMTQTQELKIDKNIIYNQDFLNLNLSKLFENSNFSIIGNFPYNISCLLYTSPSPRD